MEKIIAFRVDRTYIKLHGPFPEAVIDAANNTTGFSEKRVLLQWLNAVWPDWRKNIVSSENLV